MLRVANIQTFYGASQALFGITFSVERGEVVALIGRNGVGKTTTFRSIMGLNPPRHGEIYWHDTRIDGYPPHRIARLGIGLVPEDRRIFSGLTVWENLDIAERTFADPAMNRWDVERIYEFFPKLHSLRDRLGGYLSGGEQQMLTIARTLMGNPSLLLLDEPSEGLAPIVVEQIKDYVPKLKAEGMTILISEQSIDFSLDVCDRFYILEKGVIRCEGSTACRAEAETLCRERLLI